VRDTELMVAGDLSVGGLDPFRTANEVLGHEERVTEDVWIGCHLNVVFS